MTKRNYTIRHIENSDYIIKIKNVKNDYKFTFSHYFANMSLSNNSIAVYKSQNSVVLIREIYCYNSNNNNAIYMSKENWSKIVSETDKLSNAHSLNYLLRKFFYFQNESCEQEFKREEREFFQNY